MSKRRVHPSAAAFLFLQRGKGDIIAQDCRSCPLLLQVDRDAPRSSCRGTDRYIYGTCSPAAGVAALSSPAAPQRVLSQGTLA